jgi:beta-lactam-binding protein with PASTA domain
MRKAKALQLVGLVALAVLVGGCGRGEHLVPDVTGDRLDVAQDRLEAVGLGYDTLGGGKLGVVVRSNWFVCEQDPKPGAVAETVKLIVDRSCPLPRAVPGIVPNVTGWRLDHAQDRLARLGFAFDNYAYDSTPIRRAERWTVCDQYPAGGEVGESVDLHVEHDCDDVP